jgi:dienelactone hydrolase
MFKSIFFSILGSSIALFGGTGFTGAPTTSPTRAQTARAATVTSATPVVSPTPTKLAQIVTPTSVPPSATAVVAPSPRIEITPTKALVDEKVSIRLINAKPSQTVTLRARALDDRQVVWESHATFQVDNSGLVDLGLQKPITGTYQDLDPMGLFWSMGIESWFNTASAFAKTGFTPTPINFSAEADGQLLASAALERIFVAPDVTQTTVRDNGLAGIFFKPSGSSKYPAIIVVGGSEGGIGFGRNNGAVLASHSYATLGLAYFNYPGLPSDLINIPLEYFETAIRWLQSRDDIQTDKIAVVGLSRGAELALILGTTFPQIKSVVAYVPGDRIAGRRSGNNVGNQHAWTYRGTPLPINSPIPVEKINGPVLLISAGDDKIWPSAQMSERVIKKLSDNNFPYPYRNLYYKAAGHAGGFPYMPTTEETRPRRHPVLGVTVTSGGTPKENAFLRSDSWPQVLKFLEESLK